LSSILQVPRNVFGLLSKWGEAMLAQQEQKRHARDSRQAGRETGAELARLVELQSQEKPSFRFKLGRLLLESPQNFGRIGDVQSVHNDFTS
jgi:hypothetical protein